MNDERRPLCAVCLANDPSESWLEPVLCALPLTEKAVQTVQDALDANNRRILAKRLHTASLGEAGPVPRWIPLENLPADDPAWSRLGEALDELTEFGGWTVIPLDRLPDEADYAFLDHEMTVHGRLEPGYNIASSLAVFEAEEKHVDNTLESEVVRDEELAEWRMLLETGLPPDEEHRCRRFSS